MPRSPRRRLAPIAASVGLHVALFTWMATRPTPAPTPPTVITVRIEPTPALDARADVRPFDRTPARDLRVERSHLDAPRRGARAAEHEDPREREPTREPEDTRGEDTPAHVEPSTEGDGRRAPQVAADPRSSATASADGTGPAVGRRDPGSIDLSLPARTAPELPPLVDAPTGTGRTRALDEGRSLGLRSSGGGTYGFEDTHFRAKIARDGTVELEDRLPMPRVGTKDGLPSVEMPVDLNDTLMRLAGDDPYQYEKAKMMAATRPLREKLADAACREDLREAVLRIRPSLDQLWADDGVSSAEKRRRIFQLWDQCAEEGSDDVLLATEQIRAIIVDFISEKLPRSSPHAFPADELALLNERRRSRHPFAPYAAD